VKITILNGDIHPEKKDFSEYILLLEEKLVAGNHQVHTFNINNMNLFYCKGCWSCWWKTPGRCDIQDDGTQIFQSVINSDFVIFASPLLAGFTSSALKKITDRFVCLLHPYIQLKNGESHHQKRYEKYPDFGLLLEKEPDTDNEDIEIVKNIYERFSLNFHNQMRFCLFTETNKPEEIVYEISNN
jgi:multimeric flavodoxin WrbA